LAIFSLLTWRDAGPVPAASMVPRIQYGADATLVLRSGPVQVQAPATETRIEGAVSNDDRGGTAVRGKMPH